MAEDFWGLNLNLDDFERLLKKDDLIEEPVSIQTFVRDKKYLGLERDLSEKQLEIAKRVTQIYKPETLCAFMGEEKGLEYYKNYTVNEVVCMLGKGAGKDHTSRISMAYIVYLLHCLNDPIDYFGKAHGVTIDLLNLAVNAQQAKNVFFDPFKKLLLASPFFNDKGFEPRVSEIQFFDRPIRCFSGHSESEGWEGYEVLLVVLDEIAAFKTDFELKNVENAQRAKGSASGIYNMSKVSVISRFPRVGKVVLLSFPRYKGDFITTRYKQIEDAGGEDGAWAMKAATWEVNPTISREDLEPEFKRNPIEAEARFACNPPDMEDAYFRDPEMVREAFRYANSPVNEDGSWAEWFNGTDGFPRYIHVDLALKHDQAALCMVHLSGMKDVQTMAGIERLPILNVDYIQTWKAGYHEEIPLADIRNTINLLGKKFPVAMVTFDQYASQEMMQTLRAWGYNSQQHTVRKTDYDTLLSAIYDRRIRGYWVEQLVEQELLKLKLINNTKVDHPTTGSKDIADALAGSVFMCITNLGIQQDIDIEIWDDKSLDFDDYEIEEIITPKVETPKQIPADLEGWLFEAI
jgi:hypothetical protein